jgi:hypothetical protein
MNSNNTISDISDDDDFFNRDESGKEKKGI